MKISTGKVYDFFVKKFYFLDKTFSWVMRAFQNGLARIFFWFDWNAIFQKSMNGTAWFMAAVWSWLRLSPAGITQAFTAAFGVVLAAIVFLLVLVL